MHSEASSSIPLSCTLVDVACGAPDSSAPSYTKQLLYRDADTEVYLVQWEAEAQSPLHGHGGSSARYEVLSGELRDEHFLPCAAREFQQRQRRLGSGEQLELPPGAFHRVRALVPTVSLHIYSPPCDDSLQEVPENLAPHLNASPHHSEPPSLPQFIDDIAVEWAARESAAQRAGDACLSRATIADFRRTGVLAAPLPRELGGWNCNLADAAEAIRRLARVAPSTALALAMPLGNAAATRLPIGELPAASRGKYRRGRAWIAEQIAAGRILAVANSEPGAEGNLKSTRTVAARQTDGTYRLSGRKSFATLGPDADAFLCAARCDDHAESYIEGFFIDSRDPGLKLDDNWRAAGMRQTASVSLTLENASVAAIYGYEGCLEGINARYWSTVLFAAVFLGIGEGALAEIKQRSAPGNAWSKGKLGELRLQLDAAAALVEAVARDERYPLCAAGQARTRRAKTFAAQTAIEAATQACIVSGGRSYTADSTAFRLLCDALAGPLVRPPLPEAMDQIAEE